MFEKNSRPYDIMDALLSHSHLVIYDCKSSSINFVRYFLQHKVYIHTCMSDMLYIKHMASWLDLHFTFAYLSSSITV